MTDTNLDQFVTPNALEARDKWRNRTGGQWKIVHPHGLGQYSGYSVCNWIIHFLNIAKHHDWNGVVTSGYRSPSQQCQACINVCGNCNGCPGRCAAPGTSNHQGTDYPGGAVDVTDYEKFGNICHHLGLPLTNDLPSDPVHFSHSGH